MERRSLLQALSAASLTFTPFPALAATIRKQPTVTGLEVFRVHVNQRGDWVLPRLSAQGGLTGLGDASHGGRDPDTLRHLDRFAGMLKGRSVFDIAWFRQATLPEVGAGGLPAAVAASALEHALWDLSGQVLSLPVHALLGGRIQPRIRLYANINRSTEPRNPDGFAHMASRAAADGFDAVKLAPFDDMPQGASDPATRERYTADGIADAQAVRDAIGPGRDLLIDAHSRFSLQEGLALLPRLDPLKLFWLEEVTPAKPLSDLAAINKAAKMPTAGGENIHGVTGFYPYIRAEAVDIVMPDVKYCGGILELKKIAALAEGAGLQTSPHGPASPVGNIAAAHAIAGAPNFNILEFSYGEVPWRSELVDPPEDTRGGALALSDRPGLGYKLNEKTAARYAASP
jgi:galactonate dehydratase